MNAFAMQFAWSSHSEPGRYRDLLVWVRLRGTWDWSRFRVTPNADGNYELWAFGSPVFDVSAEVADLLVRLLPMRGAPCEVE